MKILMRFLTNFFLLLFTFSLLNAQQASNDEALLQDAREKLRTLTSSEFAGRGYLKGGHKKAADYLAKSFNRLGLQPKARDAYGNPNYQQAFEMRINLVRSASLVFGEDSLQAGRDFIVNRFSGPGDLPETRVIDMKYGLKPSEKIEGKIVLFREGLPQKIEKNPEKKKEYAEKGRDMNKIRALLSYRPAALIILRSKLTAGFGGEAGRLPILEVQEGRLPRKWKKASLAVEAGVTTIQSQNVAALLKGTEEPDSFLIVSAHYDHLGTYGNALFAGANDNASGVVMMLSMAEYFSKNRPRYSILFLGFGGEECGLKGSRFYVEKEPLVPLAQTKFVLNLDLMGNGVDGIMAVCGKDFPGRYQQLVALNEERQAVPSVRARPNAPNSDHYFFVLKGVPGFFIYTMGGPKHYHDIYDNAENLQFSKYLEVRELLIRFLERF
jgi:aminopeptidase YwaD